MQKSKTFSNGIWLNQTPVDVSIKNPDAELPYKEVTDPGYNLTIVQRCDNRTEDLTNEVNTFSTGLVLSTRIGSHLEIIPHPQLYKSGYMLVGPLVISPNNKDEIILPLLKYKDAADLELPFAAAILLVRETEYHSLQVEGGKSDRRDEFKPEKSARESRAAKGRGNHMF